MFDIGLYWDGGDGMTEVTKGSSSYHTCNICEIFIDGRFFCVSLTDYADKILDLLEENEQLKCRIEFLQNEIDMLKGKGVPFKTVEDIEKRQKGELDD